MTIIIGGGISGLSLAWFLQKAGKNAVLIEAAEHFGGALKSKNIKGYSLEFGASSLMTDSEIRAFLCEVGLENDIIPANNISKNRFLLRNKKYHPLKPSPLALITTSYFSFGAKKAIFSEFFKKSVGKENETVADFFRRRFNAEVVDYAVTPFIGGIYAGDPEKLLIEQTFPFMQELEKKYGSVLKGFSKSKSAERKEIVSLKAGLQVLPEKLAALTKAKAGEKALEINRKGDFWEVKTDKNIYQADKIVLALPAFEAARLLAAPYPEFAEKLEKTDYPPLCILHFGFKKGQTGFPLNGFGALHPQKENSFTSGCMWSSSVFEGKAEGDLITVFVGGSLFKNNTLLSDDDICRKALAEIKELYQIKGEPEFSHFYRWEKTIPQYDLNQKQLGDIAPKLQNDGILICANWYKGVSVPECIKKAKKLAAEI